MKSKIESAKIKNSCMECNTRKSFFNFSPHEKHTHSTNITSKMVSWDFVRIKFTQITHILIKCLIQIDWIAFCDMMISRHSVVCAFCFASAPLLRHQFTCICPWIQLQNKHITLTKSIKILINLKLLHNFPPTFFFSLRFLSIFTHSVYL